VLRLTREVRFAINTWTREVSDSKNGHAARPALTGLGHYFELQVTLTGPMDQKSSYLRNIKEIDSAVRTLAVPIVERAITEQTFGGGGNVCGEAFDAIKNAWPGAQLDRVVFRLSPYLSWSIESSSTMTNGTMTNSTMTNGKTPDSHTLKLSQRFEFSAAHRLHNPQLDDAENQKTFGKCNNPNAHGHNYEVQVTIKGTPDSRGVLMPVGELEKLVDTFAIEPLDHKHLNIEVPEFSGSTGLNPSVENIAMVIYKRLKPSLDNGLLDSVTVWETPKTWCEYRE